jgi:hypothetical protein
MARKWTEGTIAAQLAREVFKSDLCVLPNTVWTGHETDLLVCTTDLYLIDVEIKISRTDLKKDKEKDKWWRTSWGHFNKVTGKYEKQVTPREYPVKIWKHYYAMPQTIWKDELLGDIQPISGILLVHDNGHIECIKRAKPNRSAKKILVEHAIELARLASFRMWRAYDQVELLQEQLNKPV